jgi:hypothetical protein
MSVPTKDWGLSTLIKYPDDEDFRRGGLQQFIGLN